ncbi:MAG: asparagine synthase (glutamine-hydrolyzing) [Nitrospirota bacterium]|nr:asparagine synthase (glutamine-hydrolyzing) [Nitrospirota bacterium]
MMRQDRTPVDRLSIERMVRAMVHRGPDDEGLWFDRYVGLGHRRLSIIDRASGHQPLCNEDESVWITFNGEIYNYQDIREELLANGHTFRTKSDTEVIVHLYEDLGEGCVQRLHGMFAFAIWDRRTETLLLARDRMGIKPLYYAATPRLFAFASEVKPLLTVDEVQSSLNHQALHDYLTHRYTTAPQTMWQDIRKLEPGHLLVIRNGRMEKKAYWALDFTKKLVASEEDMIEECKRRLRASTKSHLVGEVPHGVFLSGGLDSTVIAGLVSELSGKRVKTYSVGFASDTGNYHDELPYARIAAQHFDTDHHEIVMTGRQYADGLHDFVHYMEEPMADPSAVPLYYLSQLARKSVTIMLSGEGSDELLAGYSFWKPLKGYRRAEWFRAIPRPIRRWAMRPLNDLLIGSPRLARYLHLGERPVSHYFQISPAQMTDIFSEHMKREMYGPSWEGVHVAPSNDLVRAAYGRAAEFESLDQMLYTYSTQWLPDDLLLKADKMTMAHSVELRVPFLDHSFVEFAASLPSDMKLRQTGRHRYIEKYILRKAVAGFIPDVVLNRPKLGFAVPVWTLFDTDLRKMAWDLFRSRSFTQSGLFDEQRMSRLLNEAPGGGHWWQLWPLLVFAIWQQEYQPAS